MKPLRFGLRAQMIVLFLLFSGLVSVMIATSFSEVLRTRLLDELKSKLESTVILGADSLDVSKLSRLMAQVPAEVSDEKVGELEATADYRSLSDQLNKIRNTAPQVIRFVYTFVPTTDPNLALYAVDADVLDLLARQAKGEKIDEDALSPIGSAFDLTDYEVARTAVAAKKPGLDEQYVYDKVFNVNSISGYAPILDRAGKLVAMLGIDMADTDVRQSLQQVTMLSGLITGASLVLSLVLSFLLGALLTRNVLSLRKVVERFGQQDFTARSTIKARDEIGELAGSFNLMAQTIVDYQAKIVQAEIESARNAENKKYLDHVSQGLLLMDENRIISGQYSRFLVDLFRLKESPAGQDFLDFVYPEPSSDKDELKEFLTLLSSNTNADAEMIDAVNPFKSKELVREGAVIVVDAHFVRVGQGEALESIMVVFEDKTSLREAEQLVADERRRYDAELESIAAIMRNGPVLFRDFLADGETLLADFGEEAVEELSRDKVEHYFRQFHSLKGSARSLELHKIADEAHLVEDQLAGARDHVQIGASVLLLHDALESVKTSIARFQSFGTPGQPVTPRQELDAFVASLQSMVLDLGRQLEKKVVLKTQIQGDELPFLHELKNPLIHLIRNAVDHGVEDLYERVAAAKSETAEIRLEVRVEGSRVVIAVRDDGRGIDPEAIRRSAVKKGLLAEDAAPTRQALVNLLFKPGFSNRDRVTDISGRGVGLDAAARAVKKLGGQLNVKSKPGGGTAFELTIPL